ncbi:MAG: DUF6878 family protein [Xanthobacteraceae bacterium]
MPVASSLSPDPRPSWPPFRQKIHLSPLSRFSGPPLSPVSIADAIERLAYDLLERTHCGWENNDGAYGDFTFDVAERTITLDYNERYTASEYSQHVF